MKDNSFALLTVRTLITVWLLELLLEKDDTLDDKTDFSFCSNYLGADVDFAYCWKLDGSAEEAPRYCLAPALKAEGWENDWTSYLALF